MFYGLSLSVTSVGGNDYLDFFISGAVELPAHLLCLLTVSRYGRPRPLATSLVLAALALLLIVTIPHSQCFHLSSDCYRRAGAIGTATDLRLTGRGFESSLGTIA